MVDRAAVLRRILGHEWTIAAVAALFLSLLLTRGALADPAHTLPQDIWDPSLVSYLIAWDGYALLHNPAGIWHLNAFFPASYGLAYTDSMLGYAPFAILGTGPEAAVLRYNLLYILALALVLFGGYALARQLGLGRTGSALVGVALAVAPWRLAQAGHLQSFPPVGCSSHWRCSRAVTASGGIGPGARQASEAGLPENDARTGHRITVSNRTPAGLGGRGLAGRDMAADDRFRRRTAIHLRPARLHDRWHRDLGISAAADARVAVARRRWRWRPGIRRGRSPAGAAVP